MDWRTNQLIQDLRDRDDDRWIDETDDGIYTDEEEEDD